MSNKLRVAVVGTGEWWGREHARVYSIREDTELVAVVGRTPEKTARRAAEFGTTPYTDLTTMLEAEHPDFVSLCLPNEHHFETTLEVDPGRHAAAGGEAAGLRAVAGGVPARRGGQARHVLRPQLQPPVRGAGADGRRGDPRRRARRPGLRHLALRRRAGHQRAPVRQPDRDPVPRLRHARAPLRADHVGRGRGQRPDRARVLHRRDRAVLRATAPSARCSAPTTPRTPTRDRTRSRSTAPRAGCSSTTRCSDSPCRVRATPPRGCGRPACSTTVAATSRRCSRRTSTS